MVKHCKELKESDSPEDNGRHLNRFESLLRQYERFVKNYVGQVYMHAAYRIPFRYVLLHSHARICTFANMQAAHAPAGNTTSNALLMQNASG